MRMNLHVFNVKVVTFLIVQLINVIHATKMDVKYVKKITQLNVLLVILSFIWLLPDNVNIVEPLYQDAYNVTHPVYALIVM